MDTTRRQFRICIMSEVYRVDPTIAFFREVSSVFPVVPGTQVWVNETECGESLLHGRILE